MAPINEILAANNYDSTLTIETADVTTLSRKHLSPISFSKKLLFESMFYGKIVVFENYPIRYTIPQRDDKRNFTLDLLRNNLPNEHVHIKYGLNRANKKVLITEVIDRWIRGRSKFGVTDLHFRNTDLFTKVDAGALSYFNLLPLFSEDVSFLEMLTLVISSKGIFSDSHSDDGDGSNHCIIGKKLWFAWDKTEGEKIGLQDCTYDPVYDQAEFSMKKFLALKSSQWFIVSEGQTLFMPGNFTHKVETLDSYIGFGSFYISFPNYINSLKRWILKYSSDVTSHFIEVLNTECQKYILEKVNKMDARARNEIGFPYFLKAVSNWKTGLTKKQIQSFNSNTSTKNLFQSVQNWITW